MFLSHSWQIEVQFVAESDQIKSGWVCTVRSNDASQSLPHSNVWSGVDVDRRNVHASNILQMALILFLCYLTVRIVCT